MLEYFFEQKGWIRRMRHGPLATLLDELAADLRQRGYAATTSRFILRTGGKFNRCLHHWGVASESEITAWHIGEFLEEMAEDGPMNGIANAMEHVKQRLRDHGIVVDGVEPCEESAPPDIWDPLLDRYASWGHNACGWASETSKERLRLARKFLDWCAEDHSLDEIGQLTGSKVLAFIEDPRSNAERNDNGIHLCCGIRVFLRFLHGAGMTATDLSRVIPSVPHWKLRTIPRHLPAEKVHALIDSVDTTTSVGLRDRAVLVTLAFLGLRNQEMRLMKLEHIDWRRSELLLPKTKTAKERCLPIPHEVGASLADYILNGRPPCDSRVVFLRDRAPLEPFRSPGGISGIVARHLKRAGIDTQSRGAHLLRHSLATDMVNRGVSIKEIADVLGHASIDTTAIYTKVDTAHLREVAMPFPEGDDT